VIHHVIHDDGSLADPIFDQYQREAAGTKDPLFQRRAIKANTGERSRIRAGADCITLRGRVKGQLLAQHFAVNSGASYKYIVETLSLSFENSPSCVTEALTMSVWRPTRSDKQREGGAEGDR
jgi:hypothetical protein